MWGAESQNRLLCYCNRYLFGIRNYGQTHCLLSIKGYAFQRQALRRPLFFVYQGLEYSARVHDPQPETRAHCRSLPRC
jgi:hypothetical protein